VGTATRPAALERAVALLGDAHRDAAGAGAPQGYLDLLGETSPELTGAT
jgi:hypothetical protein